jgi:hypothetical protein
VVDVWLISGTLAALMNVPPCRSGGGPQYCDPLFSHVSLLADMWRPSWLCATLRNRSQSNEIAPEIVERNR